jgi:hypothetical protein
MLLLCAAGGPITRRFFAPHPTVLQVGSTLFAHGGVLPHHVEYGLERINGETRKWLLGSADSDSGSSKGSGAAEAGASHANGSRRAARPWFLFGPDAIVWARWVATSTTRGQSVGVPALHLWCYGGATGSAPK